MAKELKLEKAEKSYPQFLVSFMMNDYAGIVSKEGLTTDEAITKISSFTFNTVTRLAHERFIDRKQLRGVIRVLLKDPDNYKMTDDEQIDLDCVFQLGWFMLYKDVGYA